MQIAKHRLTAFAAAIFMTVSSLGQGLGFRGMDARIDDRTSFSVFGNKRHAFTGEFRISFMLCTYPSGSDFGYILRMKDSNGSIWNLSYTREEDTVTFRLNEEGRFVLIRTDIPAAEMTHLKWTPITLLFAPASDEVCLRVGEHEYKASADLPQVFHPSIQFGRSDYIIDVPTYAIRSLKVEGQNRSFEFPLEETDGDTVHDSYGRPTGKVINPQWLMQEAIEWKKLAEFSLPSNSGYCYIPEKSEFWYFDSDRLIIYNCEHNSTSELEYANRCPIRLMSAANYCADGRITVYETSDQGNPYDGPMTATLDCSTLRWETVSAEDLDKPLYHHCSFINPSSRQLTVFGGFGRQMYNGDFYTLDSLGHWSTAWEGCHPTLFPRYFAACGADSSGQNIYFFGGMGNECGEQIVGRQYFYDLHRIDSSTGVCEKLWQLKWEEEDVVPARSLIVDGDSFYALCYPEYRSNSELSLYRFSIEDGSFDKHGHTIPIISDKIHTSANLYLNKSHEKFYAATSVSDDDIRSTLTIWSISYPADFGEFSKSAWRKTNLATIIRALLIILLAIAAALTVRSNLKRKKASEQFTQSLINPEKKRYVAQVRANSITLFGDFSVHNRDNIDISDRISSQQRQILLLIIKYSTGGGLSSQRLSKIIWPDKDVEKAKNSRGVAINNLRKVLSEVDGLSIIFENGYYKMQLDSRCWCDYFEYDRLIREDSRDSDAILTLLSRGKFMRDIDDQLFDSMKEKVESTLTPLLNKEVADSFKAMDYQKTIEIATMMFWIDPLDEVALKYEMRALNQIKRHEDALLRFASFSAEYRKTNGVDCPRSLGKF